ncbi:hypothetical protein PYW08_012261 [Mythimna loreyi]|uniref:Uncharacterized protein n=1 Tax=Mythimna loreyi TaxID=667449 RepID=A0ACC2Q3A3_9NEOP|nr:hypothetical protein PYW08_012261 [Mythimna loreyi]
MDERRISRRGNTRGLIDRFAVSVGLPEYGVSLFAVCNDPEPDELISDNDEAAEEKKKTFCRICLCSDRKLYAIPPQNRATFKDVLEKEKEGEEEIPQRVCFDCNARMTSCTTFMNRALQTNSLLYAIIRPFANVSEPPNGPGIPRYIAHRPRRTPGRFNPSDDSFRNGPRRLSLCLLPPDSTRIP